MAKKRTPEQIEALARQRAELIIQVRSGLLTATAAAKRLGVSRKSYYQWENKGLAAMARALTDQPGGRPATPTDVEKETLRRQAQEAQEQVRVLEVTQRIREAIAEVESSAQKK
jgi:transposase